MRSPARRRRVYRKSGEGDGAWENFGPEVYDQVTGVRYPRQIMVQQRGGWVRRDYGYGSRDKPRWY